MALMILNGFGIQTSNLKEGNVSVVRFHLLRGITVYYCTLDQLFVSQLQPKLIEFKHHCAAIDLMCIKKAVQKKT